MVVAVDSCMAVAGLTGCIAVAVDSCMAVAADSGLHLKLDLAGSSFGRLCASGLGCGNVHTLKFWLGTLSLDEGQGRSTGRYGLDAMGVHHNIPSSWAGCSLPSC